MGSWDWDRRSWIWDIIHPGIFEISALKKYCGEYAAIEAL